MRALADITLHATMKMRVRVVPSIERYHARFNQVPRALALGFASFLVHVRECAAANRRADAQSGDIRNAWSTHGDDVGAVVRQVSSDVTLWGEDLSRLAGFADEVTKAIRSLEQPA